jgi:hypothetical protein
MQHAPRTLLCLSLALGLGLAAPADAQDLRRGLAAADCVVVARQVGKKPHGDDVVLHRLQVMRDVRGADGHAAVTVLDWPNLSLHQRPMPRQSRLYCLENASVTAERLGLPASDGPYYRMSGWPGSNPLVGQDLEQDAIVRFATVLAASESGASPADTAAELCAMALRPDRVVRAEATRYLTERGDLRAKLGGLQWQQLVARATAEADDVDYKIALAELCAEQRIYGLVEALAVSLGPVDDPDFARCVGRIGKVLHGEAATEVLARRLRTVGQPKDRAMLLLAIGATNTDSALDALLRLDARDEAVEAALREHRSPTAKEAVLKKK